MRRSEFKVDDAEAAVRLLQECDFGVLSLLSGDEPYGVAVNFAYEAGALYFHGSKEGRKAKAIGTGARVSFLAVRPYAYIPSYFSDTRSACPATQYFASVHISGEVRPLDDGGQKAAGLNALMRKMQPEGGYEPVDPTHPFYVKMLEKTGVYKVTIERATLKVKAGQNLSRQKHESLMDRLRGRGTPTDLATIDTMEVFHP